MRAVSARGVLVSVSASVFFAIVFLLSGLLDAPADVVFAWRMVLTLACYLVLLIPAAGRREAREYLALLRERPVRILVLVVLAVLIGAQLWLFVWAPMHQHALDSALGFLLLPLTLVLSGRWAFGERMSRIQTVAVAIAAVAVAIRVVTEASLSWVTLAICLGYPVYFVLRRWQRMDGPAGFAFETAVLIPPALWIIATVPVDLSAANAAAVAGVGLAGAAAMILYLAAARLLPLPLFGLLSYLEPVLLVLVALLLGERIGPVAALSYALLAVALSLVVGEGARALRSRRARGSGSAEPAA